MSIQSPRTWTTHHFSQANPKGSDQANVPALLRRIAESIELLGTIEVHNISFGTEMTENGPWHHITVYFDPVSED
jgi:hypothetical protein